MNDIRSTGIDPIISGERKRYLLTVCIVAVAGVCGFLAGKATALPKVRVYTVNNHPVAVHDDGAGYGLSLTDYVLVLSLLRQERTAFAVDRLEMFLDFSLEDAKQRRGVLSEEARGKLDKVLGRVAEYRAKFPRPATGPSGVYWTAARQREVDEFLLQFRSRAGQ